MITGMPYRIQLKTHIGTGCSPAPKSSCSAAARFMHHATVITASSDPSVCIPEPNVRSQGTKIALLMEGGIESTKQAAHITHTARPRVSRVLSVRPATSTSSAPTSDKYPAPSRLTKKSAPNSQPAGIAANTLGSVSKMSPGPDAGSSLNANTAGITASPAMSDDPVSPITVHHAGRTSGSSACRYDPYTTMKVPPSDKAKIA